VVGLVDDEAPELGGVEPLEPTPPQRVLGGHDHGGAGEHPVVRPAFGHLDITGDARESVDGLRRLLDQFLAVSQHHRPLAESDRPLHDLAEHDGLAGAGRHGHEHALSARGPQFECARDRKVLV